VDWFNIVKGLKKLDYNALLDAFHQLSSSFFTVILIFDASTGSDHQGQLEYLTSKVPYQFTADNHLFFAQFPLKEGSDNADHALSSLAGHLQQRSKKVNHRNVFYHILSNDGHFEASSRTFREEYSEWATVCVYKKQSEASSVVDFLTKSIMLTRVPSTCTAEPYVYSDSYWNILDSYEKTWNEASANELRSAVYGVVFHFTNDIDELDRWYSRFKHLPLKVSTNFLHCTKDCDNETKLYGLESDDFYFSICALKLNVESVMKEVQPVLGGKLRFKQFGLNKDEWKYISRGDEKVCTKYEWNGENFVECG
jgi:hypothetical protein